MISWLLLTCAFLKEDWGHPVVLAGGASNPQPMDIYYATLGVGYSQYPRPCLIISASGDMVTISPISSQLDLYNSVRGDFMLDAGGDAALKRNSFIIGEQQTVPRSCLGKNPTGRLTGEILQRFRKRCL